MWVAPLRVAMGPVHNTAAIVGFEFTVERNRVAILQHRYSRRQVNIVRHQHSTTGSQLQDKSLMPAALVVVRQYSQHHAARLYLLARQPVFVRPARIRRVDKDRWS